MGHKARRIGDGHYIYRGYEIRRYQNEGFLPKYKYIWEAVDEYGCGFAHSGRLRDSKRMIDEEIDNHDL